MRRFPDKTESGRGRSRGPPTPQVAQPWTVIRTEDVRLSPQGKAGARTARESEAQSCQDAGCQTVVAAPGQAERARDKVRNNRGNTAEMPATPGGGRGPP